MFVTMNLLQLIEQKRNNQAMPHDNTVFLQLLIMYLFSFLCIIEFTLIECRFNAWLQPIGASWKMTALLVYGLSNLIHAVKSSSGYYK